MILTFNMVADGSHSKFHQAKCSGSWVIVHTNFLPKLATVRNPKIRSCDLDVWPMTLKFFGFRAVVKMHVPAKFHRAECSGSWVIVLTVGKELRRKLLIQSFATTQTVKNRQGNDNNRMFAPRNPRISQYRENTPEKCHRPARFTQHRYNNSW